MHIRIYVHVHISLQWCFVVSGLHMSKSLYGEFIVGTSVYPVSNYSNKKLVLKLCLWDLLGFHYLDNVVYTYNILSICKVCLTN